jgi:hypothetical protein
MYTKPRSLARRLLVAGWVAGLVTGWSGGCSEPDATNVNLKQAREALRKRTADHGETPRNQPRENDKVPAPQR